MRTRSMPTRSAIPERAGSYKLGVGSVLCVRPMPQKKRGINDNEGHAGTEILVAGVRGICFLICEKWRNSVPMMS